MAKVRGKTNFKVVNLDSKDMKLKTLSEIVDGSIPKVPLPKYLKNLLKEDEACVPSKMNILIGFLRLGNFLSATAIIYIIGMYFMDINAAKK